MDSDDDAPGPGKTLPKAKVFVSYSRTDAAFAISLSQELEARGIEVLRDVEDTLPGEEWWRRLQSLIGSADAIVFVLSRRSVESKVCRDEVATGEELKKRIFPAVIEDVDWASVPPGLAARHSVFFKGEDQRFASLDQLTQALLTDIDWIREHTRLYERAAVWQRQGRGRHELLSGRALQGAEQWLQTQPAAAESPTPLHLEYIKAGRDAATRRRNRQMVGLAAGFVFAVGLAGVALWQERVATAERDKATRNFAIAKGTAESLVFNMAQGLRDMQGLSAEAVRKILETARAAFDQLAAAAPDDLDLQYGRAAMLSEFGDTYLILGDLEAAFEAFRDNLAIVERLGTADHSTRQQYALAVVYQRIGNVLLAQGKLDEALKIYRDGFAILERLAAAEPSNTERQHTLAFAYNKVGEALLAQGKLDEALKAFRDSLAIMHRLADSDPDNREWQRGLAASYSRVGDVLLAQDKLDEALKAFRDGLTIAERLVATDRRNTLWQGELSSLYARFGHVLLAQGKREEALKAFRDGFAIVERLAAADPGNTRWQDALASSHGNLARAHETLGDIAQALAELRKGRDIVAALVALAPNHARWKSDLAWFDQEIARLAPPSR